MGEFYKVAEGKYVNPIYQPNEKLLDRVQEAGIKQAESAMALQTAIDNTGILNTFSSISPQVNAPIQQFKQRASDLASIIAKGSGPEVDKAHSDFQNLNKEIADYFSPKGLGGQTANMYASVRAEYANNMKNIEGKDEFDKGASEKNYLNYINKYGNEVKKYLDEHGNLTNFNPGTAKVIRNYRNILDSYTKEATFKNSIASFDKENIFYTKGGKQQVPESEVYPINTTDNKGNIVRKYFDSNNNEVFLQGSRLKFTDLPSSYNSAANEQDLLNYLGSSGELGNVVGSIEPRYYTKFKKESYNRENIALTLFNHLINQGVAEDYGNEYDNLPAAYKTEGLTREKYIKDKLWKQAVDYASKYQDSSFSEEPVVSKEQIIKGKSGSSSGASGSECDGYFKAQRNPNPTIRENATIAFNSLCQGRVYAVGQDMKDLVFSPNNKYLARDLGDTMLSTIKVAAENENLDKNIIFKILKDKYIADDSGLKRHLLNGDIKKDEEGNYDINPEEFDEIVNKKLSESWDDPELKKEIVSEIKSRIPLIEKANDLRAKQADAARRFAGRGNNIYDSSHSEFGKFANPIFGSTDINKTYSKYIPQSLIEEVKSGKPISKETYMEVGRSLLSPLEQEDLRNSLNEALKQVGNKTIVKSFYTMNDPDKQITRGLISDLQDGLDHETNYKVYSVENGKQKYIDPINESDKIKNLKTGLSNLVGRNYSMSGKTDSNLGLARTEVGVSADGQNNIYHLSIPEIVSEDSEGYKIKHYIIELAKNLPNPMNTLDANRIRQDIPLGVDEVSYRNQNTLNALYDNYAKEEELKKYTSRIADKTLLDENIPFEAGESSIDPKNGKIVKINYIKGSDSEISDPDELRNILQASLPPNEPYINSYKVDKIFKNGILYFKTTLTTRPPKDEEEANKLAKGEAIE